jgi:hypothetical protein
MECREKPHTNKYKKIANDLNFEAQMYAYITSDFDFDFCCSEYTCTALLVDGAEVSGLKTTQNMADIPDASFEVLNRDPYSRMTVRASVSLLCKCPHWVVCMYGPASSLSKSVRFVGSSIQNSETAPVL